jgi:hypothetical protein
MLLVGLPLHLLLQRAGHREVLEYIYVSATAVVVICLVINLVEAARLDTPGTGVGMFVVSAIVAVLCAALAASIFWAIAVKPIHAPPARESTQTSGVSVAPPK